MPLCPKVKADCVELINGELDAIRIERNEDFNLVAQELQKLIKPKECCLVRFIGFFRQPLENKPLLKISQPLLPSAAQSQIAYVSFCFGNPQDFVRDKCDYAEYKRILKDRIAAKIIELQTFKEPERVAYIKFQQEKYSSCFTSLSIS